MIGAKDQGQGCTALGTVKRNDGGGGTAGAVASHWRIMIHAFDDDIGATVGMLAAGRRLKLVTSRRSQRNMILTDANLDLANRSGETAAKEEEGKGCGDEALHGDEIRRSLEHCKPRLLPVYPGVRQSLL